MTPPNAHHAQRSFWMHNLCVTGKWVQSTWDFVSFEIIPTDRRIKSEKLAKPMNICSHPLYNVHQVCFCLNRLGCIVPNCNETLPFISWCLFYSFYNMTLNWRISLQFKLVKVLAKTLHGTSTCRQLAAAFWCTLTSEFIEKSCEWNVLMLVLKW